MKELIRFLALVVFSVFYQTSYVELFYKILPLDLLSLVAFYYTLRWKDFSAASACFFIGLLKDILLSLPLGIFAFSITAASFSLKVAEERVVFLNKYIIFLLLLLFLSLEKLLSFALSSLVGFSSGISFLKVIYSILLTSFIGTLILRKEK